jgi:dTDP-4-dehydrorhamnose 3,5-epimerase
VKLTEKARALFRIQAYGPAPTIAGVEVRELRRFGDDGGSLVELLRLDGRASGFDGFELRQVTYAAVQPGAIKAFHVHREQTDVWFVRPEDRMLLLLLDVREGSPSSDARMRLVLGDGRASLVRIPPGVAHGCRNLGVEPASLIYFTDRQFAAEPQRCDEGRLPWDFLGAEVWETTRE